MADILYCTIPKALIAYINKWQTAVVMSSLNKMRSLALQALWNQCIQLEQVSLHHRVISNHDINSSPPGQNSRLFADDIFRCIFVNEKFCISIRISLKFVPKGPIDNTWALIKVMAWRRISHYLNQCWFSPLTHVCDTRGRWVNDVSSTEPCFYEEVSTTHHPSHCWEMTEIAFIFSCRLN